MKAARSALPAIILQLVQLALSGESLKTPAGGILSEIEMQHLPLQPKSSEARDHRCYQQVLRPLRDTSSRKQETQEQEY